MTKGTDYSNRHMLLVEPMEHAAKMMSAFPAISKHIFDMMLHLMDETSRGLRFREALEDFNKNMDELIMEQPLDPGDLVEIVNYGWHKWDDEAKRFVDVMPGLKGNVGVIKLVRKSPVGANKGRDLYEIIGLGNLADELKFQREQLKFLDKGHYERTTTGSRKQDPGSSERN